MDKENNTMIYNFYSKGQPGDKDRVTVFLNLTKTEALSLINTVLNATIDARFNQKAMVEVPIFGRLIKL